MNYDGELRFLKDVLKKLHIDAKLVNADEIYKKMFDKNFVAIFGSDIGYSEAFENIYGGLEALKIYQIQDSLSLCFICMLLPEIQPETALVIGPFLREEMTKQKILKLCEKYGIEPSRNKYMWEYYQGLAVLESNSPVFSMIEIFGERVWGGPGNFSVVDLRQERVTFGAELREERNEYGAEKLMADMELMQKRYDFENELIRAVELGQEQTVTRMMVAFQDSVVEPRLSDPIRNIKNYCIITNTLLRKAAERGGVHPLYINDISTEFAQRIEMLLSMNSALELMREMFSRYCRAVRRYSMKSYSSVIRRVLTIIYSDVSADLSLSTLAKSQNVSAGYLSALFKKETGKTVSQFVLDERMKLAKRLLSTTTLQVQTVALHCGTADLQYFSKIFKNYTGQTPKEYRKNTV